MTCSPVWMRPSRTSVSCSAASWPMRMAWKPSRAAMTARAGRGEFSAPRSVSRSTAGGILKWAAGTRIRNVGSPKTILAAFECPEDRPQALHGGCPRRPRLGQDGEHVAAADLAQRGMRRGPGCEGGQREGQLAADGRVGAGLEPRRGGAPLAHGLQPGAQFAAHRIRQPGDGDLEPAHDGGLAVFLGTVRRRLWRGGGSG